MSEPCMSTCMNTMHVQVIERMASTQYCKTPDMPNLAVLLSFVLMYVSSRWFSNVILRLVGKMAPDQVPDHYLNWIKMWLGMIIQQIVIPFVLLRNLNRHEITWARIRYRIRHGKVDGIEHALHATNR
jgi:hypothetical protein